MTQPNWSARLVRSIAGEVKRHREAQDMSAQRLADRCAELGHPIPRSVLANLESGRRETISVPELFILAQALKVPPLLLLLPLGHAETVEILPGAEVLTTDALRWLLAEAWINQPWAEGNGGDSTVASFVVHRQNVDRWLGYRGDFREAAAKDDTEAAEHFERQMERTAEHLRSLRALMRARGLVPPAIPEPLAYIDRGRS